MSLVFRIAVPLVITASTVAAGHDLNLVEACPGAFFGLMDFHVSFLTPLSYFGMIPEKALLSPLPSFYLLFQGLLEADRPTNRALTPPWKL